MDLPLLLFSFTLVLVAAGAVGVMLYIFRERLPRVRLPGRTLRSISALLIVLSALMLLISFGSITVWSTE